MINLFYSEAYWGHSATMNGPHKVVNNLIKSLDQEKIGYAINEEKYEHNFVALFRNIIRRPLAIGSSIPEKPAFFCFSFFLICLKVSLDDIPDGLFINMQL